MFLWRKLVEPRWIKTNEQTLRQYAGNDLAIIDRPGQKRSRLEVACKSRGQVRELVNNFGGCIETLPRDWLERIARRQKTKPLRVGKRLIVENMGDASASRKSRRKGPSHLVIPAGAAFGTGEHVTTAMCLRMLEEITRLRGAHAPRVPVSAPRRKLFSAGESVARGAQRSTRGRVRSPESPWSLLDLGTGSGILALAAKRFGADRVLGIDVDSIAISTARTNARLNKISNIDFRVIDMREWRPKGKFDIIVANLFGELLIKILPKLKANLARGGQVILSGVLRAQEGELNRALRLNQIDIMQVRRRGKWIAILAKKRGIR